MAAADASTGLCVMLEELGNNSQPNLDDLKNFYDAVFEFGHLNESAVLEFSDAERISIMKSYPDAERVSIMKSYPLAVENAAKLTPDLIQGRSSAELNQLLPKIKLLTDDLFELYKAAVEDKVPTNVEENIQKLKSSQSEVEKKLAS
uniref:Uncharacterized protein n=1 Tax=Panagrolaimus sp. ES5 TaxID=591445 RepID=A0AC34FLL7_9BILA